MPLPGCGVEPHKPAPQRKYPQAHQAPKAQDVRLAHPLPFSNTRNVPSPLERALRVFLYPTLLKADRLPCV